MNAHFKPIKNDYFKTLDNRNFKIINVWWQGGLMSNIEFIEVFDEPQPTEIIRQPYYVMESLFINKKIILL